MSSEKPTDKSSLGSYWLCCLKPERSQKVKTQVSIASFQVSPLESTVLTPFSVSSATPWIRQLLRSAIIRSATCASWLSGICYLMCNHHHHLGLILNSFDFEVLFWLSPAGKRNLDCVLGLVLDVVEWTAFHSNFRENDSKCGHYMY